MDKKKVLIGGIVAISIVIGLGFSALTQKNATPEQKTATTVTNTTSKNTDTKAEETSDQNGLILSDDSDDTSSKTPVKKEKLAKDALAKHYVNFVSVDQFKKTEGTRALFFFRESSKDCQSLDADIKKHSSLFKSDTTVFKIDIDKYADIAKAYGVIKEGTVLKYDDKGQVDGVFIATDYPTAAALRTNLQI